jgi:hypothetical protein
VIIPDNVIEEIINWHRPIPDDDPVYEVPRSQDGRRLKDLIGQEVVLEGEGYIWAGSGTVSLILNPSLNPPWGYEVRIVTTDRIPLEFHRHPVRVTGKLDLRWDRHKDAKVEELAIREKSYFLDDAHWEFVKKPGDK